MDIETGKYGLDLLQIPQTQMLMVVDYGPQSYATRPGVALVLDTEAAHWLYNQLGRILSGGEASL